MFRNSFVGPFLLVTQSLSTEVANKRDGDRQTNKLYDKHCDDSCPCAEVVSGKPVPQFHKTTLFPVGLGEVVAGVLNTAGDWNIPTPVCHTMNSTATEQVLNSIKVFLNGLIPIWTGISVDLQASHQISLKVCVNLSAVNQEHTGHGQLHQHQNEQQDKERNEHAAVLPHASQHSHITHTGDDGAGDHQGVGGVDGPEGGDERGELGVHHLELTEGHHEGTTQPAEEVERHYQTLEAAHTGAIHPS